MTVQIDSQRVEDNLI